MRKYILFILTIAIFAACTNGIEEQDTIEPMIFYAAVENSTETKVHLNDEFRSRWDADDSVSIFAGNTYNHQFRFDGKTGDNSGSFSQVADPAFISGERLSTNYAVYPYNSGTSISETGLISVSFPSVQNYAEGSFGIGANTMVAVTENSSDYFLHFKNVCGYLKVSLYGNATISRIVLRGNNGEKIVGAGTVTASYSDAPSVTMSSSATESITIDCGKGVKLGSESTATKDFYFVIPPVEFSNGITITATATSGKVFEKSTSNPITISRNKIQEMAALEYNDELAGYISFKDPNFKAYCVQQFDLNNDGEISYEEAAAVTTISCGSRKIASIDEIKYFTSLYYLNCSKNQLTSLDVSNNTELNSCTCDNNQLTSLDLSKNKKLTRVVCGKNQLTSLDVRNNTELTYIKCYSNQLTSLDVSNNTKLTDLSCYNNQLTSLDVRNNTELTYFYCYSNQLTSLDVSQNTKLTNLSCYNNQLTSLDVSKNTQLIYLLCSPMNDEKGNNLLKTLYIYNGQEISGVTSDRSSTNIPNETEIKVID